MCCPLPIPSYFARPLTTGQVPCKPWGEVEQWQGCVYISYWGKYLKALKRPRWLKSLKTDNSD